SRPLATPAPTGWTSPSSSPRSSGIWLEPGAGRPHGRRTKDRSCDPNQPRDRHRRAGTRLRFRPLIRTRGPECQQGLDGGPAAVRRPQLGLATRRGSRSADPPGGQASRGRRRLDDPRPQPANPGCKSPRRDRTAGRAASEGLRNTPVAARDQADGGISRAPPGSQTPTGRDEAGEGDAGAAGRIATVRRMREDSKSRQFTGDRFMKIAVIGMGTVGGLLGRRWAAAGHAVTFGVRNPQDPQALADSRSAGVPLATRREAAASAEVVLLAVPWSVARQAATDLGDLAGKVLL